MRCIDKEQLMFFVEGEADNKAVSEIQAHLQVCGKCRHEVESLRLVLNDEYILRNKINNIYAKHTFNKKIMSAVLAEPRPKQVKNSFSWLNNWFVKFMVPALAIAFALFVILSGSPSQIPQKYIGNQYRVSVMASNSNNESFIDGELYTTTLMLKPLKS